METIQSIFSDHTGINLEINNRKNIWKISKFLEIKYF